MVAHYRRSGVKWYWFEQIVYAALRYYSMNGLTNIHDDDCPSEVCGLNLGIQAEWSALIFSLLTFLSEGIALGF